jgi:hypothetical protein
MRQELAGFGDSRKRGAPLPSGADAARQEVHDKPVETGSMKTVRNLAIAAMAAALLAGCGSVPKDEAPAAQAGSPAGSASTPEPEGPAKIVSLPYRVDLTYTEAARDRLRETAAKMGVSADYYGAPKDPAAENLDPDLGIWLGGEMEVLKDGRASITMRGEVNASTVAREVAGDVRVRVMAFPVQSPLAANDVTCDTFDDVLPITVETGAVIHCTLKGK